MIPWEAIGGLIVGLAKAGYERLTGKRRFDSAADMAKAAGVAKSATTEPARPTYGTDLPQPPATPPRKPGPGNRAGPGTAALAAAIWAASGCATIRHADYAVTPAGLDVVVDVDAMGPVQVGMVASPDGVHVCAAPALSSAAPVCVWAEPRE